MLFLRSIAATICCGIFVLALGHGRAVGKSLSKGALLRAALETASVLCYVFALASMPIADVIAIVQTAPIVLILPVALVWREPVGAWRIALIAVGFAGALLVAQPTADGLSPVAWLALASAFGVALRDLVGRGIPSTIPALVVTFATVVIVMIGSGVAMVSADDLVMPSPKHALYLTAAGLFVTLGHFGIFMAYRLGAPGVIAPFFYSFAVWAVAAGLLVFHELPDPVALLGIAAIMASGLGIVLFDRRMPRTPAAAP